jgi:hypothetical protein
VGMTHEEEIKVLYEDTIDNRRENMIGKVKEK